MRVVSTHDCMTLWHSYTFFKTLADFCRINENRPHFHISRWDLWTVFILVMNACGFFSTYIFHQFGRVKSLQVVGAWLDFIPKTSPASPKKGVHDNFHEHTVPFGSRHHHKKSLIQENHLESPKPTMYKWSAINWMMISHLCIGKMRTKKFTKLQETHPLEKDGRIGISGVRCRQGFKVWPYGDRLRQAPRTRWCHGDGTSSGGEETISISRWAVELILRWVVQCKKLLT